MGIAGDLGRYGVSTASPARACRGFPIDVGGQLPCAVAGETQDARAAPSLGSVRLLRVRLRRMVVVQPTELLGRAVRRSCRWLCQQSDGAGQGDIRARVAVVPRGTAASPRPWFEGAASGASGAYNPNDVVMSRARRVRRQGFEPRCTSTRNRGGRTPCRGFPQSWRLPCAIVGLRTGALDQAWQCPTAAMRLPGWTRPPANSGASACPGPDARSSHSTS